jgi:hypothetical protein
MSKYLKPEVFPRGGADIWDDGLVGTLFTADIFAQPAPSTGGTIKVYLTSVWLRKPIKVWNGSAWQTKPLKRWNGSAWVAT